MNAKRLSALLLVFAMLFVSVPATAADDTKERRVLEVTLNSQKITVRVNKTRMLFADIWPLSATDQSLYWSSSNREIATVDGDGMVRGISPGTATITVQSVNGIQATCEVTVSDLILEMVTDKKTGEQDAWINGGETLSASELLASASGAIADGKKILTFRNKTSLSAEALASAANAASYKSGRLTLRFDTMGAGGGVQGRLQFDAAEGNGDIGLGVYTSEERVGAVQEKFGRFFGKPVAVIVCGQKESFGMIVEIAAKPDLTGLDTGKLLFYSYNIAENVYSAFTPENFWLDSNGYLHLVTDRAGAILITS